MFRKIASYSRYILTLKCTLNLEERLLYYLQNNCLQSPHLGWGLFLIEIVRGIFSRGGRGMAVIGNFAISIHNVGSN